MSPTIIDEPACADLLRSSMVARIATLSRNGRPNINPLYFLVREGRIRLGTSDRTLAARNVEADSRVTILFENERDPGDHRLLRVRGHASVERDRDMNRRYRRGVTRKYMATRAGLRDLLEHYRQLPVFRRYLRSGDYGRPCVIEVVPGHVEWLDRRPPASGEVPSTEPGTFIWNELITEELGECGSFYSDVFGWERTETDAGPMGTYTLFRSRGRDVAGMMRPTASDYSGSPPPRWNGYIAVDDADAVAAAAIRSGGSIIEPPHDIPGVGRLAMFSDPGGALVYVLQPEAAPDRGG